MAAVPDGDLLRTLDESGTELTAWLLRRAPGALAERPAPGKWTVGETMQHVIDTERVFTFRLLWIARGAPDPLPGFDQDAWVPHSGAAGRT
ncbi:MAG: DinB family protein, partial [Gemmatimonadetes bacterium]|nr:DinB family protein [Gemmatimonadota bacterium]